VAAQRGKDLAEIARDPTLRNIAQAARHVQSVQWLRVDAQRQPRHKEMATQYKNVSCSCEYLDD